VRQTCPDPSDGPSIAVNAVEDAHRALVANPTTPLPPACVVAAFARISVSLPDSLDAHALALSTELGRRGAEPRDLLPSEIILLSRTRRYADASRAYDRLLAIDPQPPIEVVRLAIAAARQRRDTAALVRILSAAVDRPDASSAMRAELNVLRQVRDLVTAINEARGMLRQNPRYVAAYPSLVGNYGTLGMADSVVTYIRRALAQGVARASVASALEPFVNAMLRHASLYSSTYTYGWDAEVSAAIRVDSALSTPSTKFLVASMIVQSVEPQVAQIGSMVSGTRLPRATGASADDRARNHASGCERIASLMASAAGAESRLREGGDRYAGGGVSQLRSAVAAVRSRLTSLQEACGR
jgi:hypothetical protein